MSSPSKNEMESDLPVPGLIFLIENGPESISPEAGSIGGVRLRRPEPRRVQGVEELTGDFKVHAFLDVKLLGNRQIEVIDALNAAVGEIPGRSARYLIGRMREGVRVKVICRSIGNLIETRSAAGIADQVRPLMTVGQELIRIIHRKRL